MKSSKRGCSYSSAWLKESALTPQFDYNYSLQGLLMKSSKRALLLLCLTITKGPAHEKLKESALTPQLDSNFGACTWKAQSERSYPSAWLLLQGLYMKSSKRALLLLSFTITTGPVHEKLKESNLTPQLDYYYRACTWKAQRERSYSSVWL